MTTHRSITFTQAIREALFQAMEMDDSVICYGLGVPDPKGVFGTTLGLQERFGPKRVFDMPASENAMTGIAIGASLNGIRPIMTHQRLDFALLSMDQLVNNAAKWHYMFGAKKSVPITIRLIVGRGWGQGPTHSQNLQAWFAHVPGLKVVMPAMVKDAKGVLLSSIFDDNPVIFLEHRWLHNQEDHCPEGDYRIPMGRANRLRSGKDITIVSFSYMTIEALHAVRFLEENGVSCDLIDLPTLKPMDWEAIFSSVTKTGRLLVLDTGPEFCAISSEIIAQVSLQRFHDLKQPPARLALPDFPTPTSPALTRHFYKRARDIVLAAKEIIGINLQESTLTNELRYPHDVPGNWFQGPF